METDHVGEGTNVWAYAHLMAGCRVGKNCNIGNYCFVESGARIGNGVTIKNGVMIWEGVELGDGVFVGPGVVFTNDLRPRSPRLPQARERYQNKENWLLRTTIEKGVSLGAGTILLPGITVGRYAFVGAGSLVVRNVPSHALMKGRPAERSGWACECGHPLPNDSERRLVCEACQMSYVFDPQHESLQLVR